MKNKGLIITLISIFSLLIISLIILMCILINNKSSFNFRLNLKQESYELQLEKEYEEIFKEINIDTKSANIEIKKSEDNTIKVKSYSKEEGTTIDTKNETLSIKIEDEKCKFLCINTKISKLELYIPENYENKININNKYGDITIDKFENIIIDIEEDAGNIKIDTVNSANINNKYGDVKIENINKGNITASTGDIEINTANNLKIENKYGDVELDTVNEYINIDVKCGDVEIDNLNIIEDSYINNDYGDIKVKRTNAFIDAKTKLGDSKINNNQSDVTLKITNNCGDIEVN